MTTVTEKAKPKFDIPAITAEYKPFWFPLFKHMGLEKPTFGAKLCYLGKEFTDDGSPAQLCVRFFANELNSGNDYYTELFTWEAERHHPTQRVLYRLRHNPHWESQPHKYAKVVNFPTYAVRLTDLEIVNVTEGVDGTSPDLMFVKNPVFSAPAANVRSEGNGSASAPSTLFTPTAEDETESLLSEMFTELEDQHYSALTIRDLYCILQNVPMSQKKWLNSLITKGKEWQQQK